eukprot:5399156-Amphidinium_carterae.1
MHRTLAQGSAQQNKGSHTSLQRRAMSNLVMTRVYSKWLRINTSKNTANVSWNLRFADNLRLGHDAKLLAPRCMHCSVWSLGILVSTSSLGWDVARCKPS